MRNFAASILLLALYQTASVNAEVILEWSPVKVFQREEPAFEANAQAVTRARVWKDDVYVALSRQGDAGPITLGKAVWDSWLWLKSPIVKPFPDWPSQQYGDCSALQTVEDIELDSKGRLWALDGGSLNAPNRCPPKLVIFAGDEVQKTVRFPPREGMVCDNSSLRHLEVDRKGSSYYAYISDSTCPGLIVYSLKTDGIWRLEHDSFQPIPGLDFGTSLAVHGPLLYYSPAGSGNLYTLQTWALRDLERDLGISVETVGDLLGPNKEMVIDKFGILYYYVPSRNAMVRWDTRTSCEATNHVVLSTEDIVGDVTDLTTDGKNLVFAVTNYYDSELNNTASRCFSVYQYP